MLACVIVGAVVGVPLALVGYRHSWAWGYAGVIVIAAGIVIGLVAALLLRLVRRELKLSHVVVSAIVVAWIVSSVQGTLTNHFRRVPDYTYFAGFSTGQGLGQSKASLTAATAQCQQVASVTTDRDQRTAPARYLAGCLAGWRYQDAHPTAQLNAVDLNNPPADLNIPTIRAN